eukprot:TRINITY_DN2909_c0_g1_i2.p1 TRINITY_DN2909_c0_g1~~TRINITY_DN2909_c0_g1_i2.p1  ORF type:complete len:140 (-),score=17.13 TRINITY_DN2909_c0_g1_i2:852-1271(-)
MSEATTPRARKPMQVIVDQPEDGDTMQAPLSPRIAVTEPTPLNPIDTMMRGPSPHSATVMLSPFNTSHGKVKWPELVGANGEDAVRRIKADNPDVDPVILKHYDGEPEFTKHRCLIFVDDDNKVVRAPMVEFAEVATHQ